MLTSDDTFRFAVEYDYNEPEDFYLAIAVHDIRRGGITFDTGPRKLKMKKHHLQDFQRQAESEQEHSSYWVER